MLNLNARVAAVRADLRVQRGRAPSRARPCARVLDEPGHGSRASSSSTTSAASRRRSRSSAQWVAEGKVKDRHTIVEGLERAPDAVNMLFDGDNLGKLIVKLEDATPIASRRPAPGRTHPGSRLPGVIQALLSLHATRSGSWSATGAATATCSASTSPASAGWCTSPTRTRSSRSSPATRRRSTRARRTRGCSSRCSGKFSLLTLDERRPHAPAQAAAAAVPRRARCAATAS